MKFLSPSLCKQLLYYSSSANYWKLNQACLSAHSGTYLSTMASHVLRWHNLVIPKICMPLIKNVLCKVFYRHLLIPQVWRGTMMILYVKILIKIYFIYCKIDSEIIEVRFVWKMYCDMCKCWCKEEMIFCEDSSKTAKYFSAKS